jgi:uncharacterized membrane protein
MSVPFRRESEETDRLLALTDGVIAIAITLLVLEITVPEVPPGTPLSVAEHLLLDRGQEYFGYVLSFLVVGNYWALHRRVFVHIEYHDRGLVWLNLLFLLLVAFVPYGTSVFSTYPNRVGVTFVAAVLALTGVSLAALWIYASRSQLLEEGLASRTVAIQAARFLASPLVFLVSIALATVNPTWAMFSWLLLLPVNGLLNTRLARSIEAASGEPEP